MRLTLRTMLAHLDDILEREDAEVIGKKIGESAFATNLLHRIRDVTRRLRLGAPAVMDRGEGLDPNTVAEYLDNTLSDVQVPDFEKVCLESDVHLAEVASCHQVLAMVLGEPAEVDPDSRQRMYQLPDLAAGSGAVAKEAATLAGKPGSHDGADRQAAEDVARQGVSRVPEYLRDPPTSRKTRRWLATLSVAAVGIAIVWAISHPPTRDLLLSGRWRSIASQEEAQTPLSAEPVNDSREDAGSGRETPPQGLPAPPGRQPLLPTPGEGSFFQKPEDLPGPEATGKAGRSGRDAGSVGPLPAEPILPPDQGKPEETPSPKSSVSVRPEVPWDAAARSAEPKLKQPPGATDSDARPLPPAPPGPEVGAGPGLGAPEKTPTFPPLRVGVLASPKEVLLRVGPRAATWQRVADQGAISSQDRLLAVPGQRPSVTLAGKVRLHLIDGAVVQFLPSGPQGPLSFSVEHGRVLLRAEEGPVRLRVQVGDHVGLLGLEGTDGAAAIEARRLEAPGADPETQPGPIVGEVFAVTGRLLWQEETGAKSLELNAPDRLPLGRIVPEKQGSRRLPSWVTGGDTVNPLDQRAAVVVERNLLPDRTAVPALRDLTKNRQREVRWMAMRGLALAGDFGLLLEGLRDTDQKLLWADLVEQLRGAVVRGPQSAAQVRTDMEKAYGPEGASLYEMLWKYHPDSLRPEDAAQLIEQYIDHDQLAFRVLTWWNLKSITGLTFAYRPEDPRSKRQVAIQRWRDRLRTMPTLRSRGAVPTDPSDPRPEITPTAPEEPAEPAGPARASSSGKEKGGDPKSHLKGDMDSP